MWTWIEYSPEAILLRKIPSCRSLDVIDRKQGLSKSLLIEMKYRISLMADHGTM
jgi:hypothetical protein